MEFSIHARRRRATLVLGLVLASAAGGASYLMGNNGDTTAAPAATRSILVAADDIPARTIIDASHLELRTVPDSDTLAATVDDPRTVMGLLTGITILRNQPIALNMFVSENSYNSFGILKPADTMGPDTPLWRAASVKVPRDRAVGGQIKPGQRVDLMATVGIAIFSVGPDGKMIEAPSAEGYYSESTTKISWTDLEVLGVDAESDLYVLRVTLHDAEEIGHLQSDNDAVFGFVLRPELDTREVPLGGYGETTNRIIEEHLFPLPQIIDTGRYPQPSQEAATPVPSPTPIASPVPPAPVTPDPGSSLAPLASDAPAPSAPPAGSAAPAVSDEPVASLPASPAA